MKAGMEYKIMVAASLLLLIMVFSVPVSETISEAVSKGKIEAGLINAVIIIAGASSVIGGWRYYEGFVFHRSILAIFGISLALTSIFNQVPANDPVQNNLHADMWHSYFTATASLSFIILTLSTAFISERKSERILAVATAFSVLVLSVVMYKPEATGGIVNRIILVIVYGWMLYTFRNRE